MKAIMLSIQPKWCELIASGKKTIEVRKTRPQLETPFKCYIYCTQIKDKRTYTDEFDIPIRTRRFVGNSHVVGEFVCDRIYSIEPHNDGYSVNQYTCGWKYWEDNHCLNFEQIKEYLGNKNGYGWHISDLKIYDTPKDYFSFLTPSGSGGVSGNHYLTRPPQSWCYIESL